MHFESDERNKPVEVHIISYKDELLLRHINFKLQCPPNHDLWNPFKSIFDNVFMGWKFRNRREEGITNSIIETTPFLFFSQDIILTYRVQIEPHKNVEYFCDWVITCWFVNTILPFWMNHFFFLVLREKSSLNDKILVFAHIAL